VIFRNTPVPSDTEAPIERRQNSESRCRVQVEVDCNPARVRLGSGGVAIAQSGCVRLDSPAGCHYFPKWVTGLWLSLGIVMLLFGVGCRRGVPAVDAGPKPPAVQRKIAGIVRGPEGTSPVAGRTVEIIDTATGERRAVRTAEGGGFTVAVPPGKYRLELAVRDGETIVKRPGIVDMDDRDIDANNEFVLGPVRIVHPRSPAYRLDNGLGFPVARLRQGFGAAGTAFANASATQA
jgi:Carboxypeptidase regulatory-like domain